MLKTRRSRRGVGALQRVRALMVTIAAALLLIDTPLFLTKVGIRQALITMTVRRIGLPVEWTTIEAVAVMGVSFLGIAAVAGALIQIEK
jgi:hypothetical protein